MVFIGVALVIAAVLALSGGIFAAVTYWGTLPLFDAIWGIELPFWPTFIVTWVIAGLVSSIFGKA